MSGLKRESTCWGPRDKRKQASQNAVRGCGDHGPSALIVTKFLPLHLLLTLYEECLESNTSALGRGTGVAWGSGFHAREQRHAQQEAGAGKHSPTPT